MGSRILGLRELEDCGPVDRTTWHSGPIRIDPDLRRGTFQQGADELLQVGGQHGDGAFHQQPQISHYLQGKHTEIQALTVSKRSLHQHIEFSETKPFWKRDKSI